MERTDQVHSLRLAERPASSERVARGGLAPFNGLPSLGEHQPVDVERMAAVSGSVSYGAFLGVHPAHFFNLIVPTSKQALLVLRTPQA
jgi:hypothetical protein